jgi:GDP-D-mannose dehydratase
MTRKRALITGITGQDGAYLAKFLLENDYEVYGLRRQTSLPNEDRLAYLGVADHVQLIDGDILDQSSISAPQSRTRYTIWLPSRSSVRRGESRCSPRKRQG